MSLPNESNITLAHELALRVLAGVIAAGLYEFDRHLLGLEQGLSTCITIVPVLWWGVIQR